MQEQIIILLKNSQDFLSGEEISAKLNISRAGIWKYIQELRRIGYKIQAFPHLGYKLISTPDKLLPWEITRDLGTKIIGCQMHCYPSVGSTMDEAFQLGVSGLPEGLVVCAETQNKGRGRMGRSWVSPKGKGIYMSVILRPQVQLSEVSKITLLSAVALCEAVIKVSGVPARIKWPNDILVGNKKLAGILTELSAEVDRVRFLVAGLGINVNTLASQLPPQATSLRIEAKKSFVRTEILKEILRSFDQRYLELKQNGFEPVLKRWKELSATLGKQVRLSDAGRVIEGEAYGLAPDGGLLIRDREGVTIKKMSGDVVTVG